MLIREGGEFSPPFQGMVTVDTLFVNVFER